MSTKTLDFVDIERKIFWSLGALLSLMIFFYLYSVVGLTLAVVERDSINRTIHDLSVTSGAVESEYLAMSNHLTLAYAQSLGFQELNVKYSDNFGSSKDKESTQGPKLSLARAQ